jgi:hypothetical protein
MAVDVIAFEKKALSSGALAQATISSGYVGRSLVRPPTSGCSISGKSGRETRSPLPIGLRMFVYGSNCTPLKCPAWRSARKCSESWKAAIVQESQ